jgi:glycosyltransferase involved in cell wall biosynthesis
MGNKKKNLVLLIPQMKRGGAERVVSRLSFLLSKEHNIKILVFDDSVITYEVGCDLYSLNIAPRSDKKVIAKIQNAIKRIVSYRKFKKNNSIDITYSFGDTANLVNILSFGKDKKIISIRGFKGIRQGKSLIEKALLKPISVFLCKRADRIVSVSKLMSKTIAKEYNIDERKIYTSYNGYDTKDIFNRSLEELNEFENKVFTDNKTIITAGTFKEEKGYWHLLKSFSELIKVYSDIKLVILGENYRDNENKVKKLADELNIKDSLIFMGYKSNPYKYFSKSTVYVLSSTFEGFPNAMVEAMSCGVPIIASDCQSGPREILAPNTNVFDETETYSHEEYGILVERMNKYENYNPEDIESCDKNLANALEKILTDDKLIKYYAEKAKIRAAHFSYEYWLEKQKRILEI